jgi:hypothetical protein
MRIRNLSPGLKASGAIQRDTPTWNVVCDILREASSALAEVDEVYDRHSRICICVIFTDIRSRMHQQFVLNRMC